MMNSANSDLVLFVLIDPMLVLRILGSRNPSFIVVYFDEFCICFAGIEFFEFFFSVGLVF